MASAEAITYAALKTLAGGRVYPDVAPASAVKPYVVYQSVGGVDETTFDGLNQQQNSRMQVAVWALSRAEAATLMQQMLRALTDTPVRGVPAGAPVSVYEDETRLYGSRVDVSIWFAP
ncbi:DUF3168 domain-containing protein [Paraburkholderia bonniea]|uniref:DUF3168 domain-containing protein n=1 Tax=Paraburkholderia bonniea TaxID=2152891 RepID=UPI001291F235|nr:DUF3168 domain-containing protein [Paraburkholderia bonniea]WJF91999.1 DUF3168 domain-containing protein [Paraburkholderia bonniea]WJF95318.1 DUF3168 domain-containing protein [Paraburkholderia bonniea]